MPKSEQRPMYKAWGEEKTLPEWAADERCTVSVGTLRWRMRQRQPEDRMEDVIGKPRGWHQEWRRSEDRAAPSPAPRVYLTAWGETKNVAQWAQDPRCNVTENGLRSRVAAMQPGGRAEDAIAGSRDEAIYLTAWGETKSVYAWARDARCVVGESTLRTRAEAMQPGGTAEDILTRPTVAAASLTAWGETKTLTEWVADPRCAVPLETLRLRRHKMQPHDRAEDIISRPSRSPGMPRRNP